MGIVRTTTTWFKNKVKHQSQGQIKSKSQLGMWIYLLSLDPKVRQIVEIGTWNGQGSTAIIRDAAVQRLDSISVYSLEANKNIFDIARTNVPNDGVVNLLLGHIVSVSDLDTQMLTEEEMDWYLKDRKAIEQTPNVLGALPEAIHLCVLDGGEFSSYAEFTVLYSRLDRWLILDDTLVRKNKLVHQSLLGNPDWTLVASGSDRNGWAVWLRQAR
jgi:hypothetical protein